MPLKDSKYIQAPTIRVGNANVAYLLCSNGQNLSLRGTRELLTSDGNYLYVPYSYSPEDLASKPNIVATISDVRTLIAESGGGGGSGEDTPIYLHDRTTIHNDLFPSGADVTIDPVKGFFLSAKGTVDPSDANLSTGLYWEATPALYCRGMSSSLLVNAGRCNLTLKANKICFNAAQGLVYNNAFNTNWKATTSHYIPTISIVHCLIEASGGSGGSGGGGGEVEPSRLYDRTVIYNDSTSNGIDLILNPLQGVFLSSGQANDCKGIGMYWLNTVSSKTDGSVSTDLKLKGTCFASILLCHNGRMKQTASSLIFTAGNENTSSEISTLSLYPGNIDLQGKSGLQLSIDNVSVYLASDIITLTAPGGVELAGGWKDCWSEHSNQVTTVSFVRSLISGGGSYYHEDTAAETATIRIGRDCTNFTSFSLDNKRHLLNVCYTGGSNTSGVALAGKLFVYSRTTSSNSGIIFNSPSANGCNNSTMLLDTAKAVTMNSVTHTVHPSKNGYAALTFRSLYPVAMQFVCSSVGYCTSTVSQDLATVSIVHTLMGNANVVNYSSCIDGLKSTITYLEGEVDALQQQVNNGGGGQSDASGDSGGGASSAEITELSNKITEVDNKTESLAADVTVLRGCVSTASSTASRALTTASTANGNASSAKATADKNTTDITKLSSRVDVLEAADTSLGSRVDVLEAADTSLESRVDVLEAADTSLGSRVKVLEDADTSLGSRVDVLEAADTSLGSRVKVLEDASSSGGGDSLVEMSQRVTTLEGTVEGIETTIGSITSCLSAVEAHTCESIVNAGEALDKANRNTTNITKLSSRVDVLEAADTSLGSRVKVLEDASGAGDPNLNAVTERVTTLEETTSGMKTSITDVTNKVTNICTNALPGIDAAITHICQSTNSLGSRVDVLEAADTSLGSRVDVLEAADTSLESRVDVLEAADTSLGSRVKVLEDAMTTGNGCTCDMETVNQQIHDLSDTVTSQNAAIEEMQQNTSQEAIDTKISTNATVQKLVTDVDALDVRIVVLENAKGNNDANTARIAALESKDAEQDVQFTNINTTLDTHSTQLTDHETRITTLETSGGGGGDTPGGGDSGGGDSGGGEDNPGGDTTEPKFEIPEKLPATITVDPALFSSTNIYGVPIESGESILNGVTSSQLATWNELTINSPVGSTETSPITGIALGDNIAGVGIVKKIIIPPYVAATTGYAVGEWGINLYAKPSYWKGNTYTMSPNYACIAKSTNTFKLTNELTVEAQVVNFDMTWQDIEAIDPTNTSLMANFLRPEVQATESLLRDSTFPSTMPTSKYKDQTPPMPYAYWGDGVNRTSSETHMVFPTVPQGVTGYWLNNISDKNDYKASILPIAVVTTPKAPTDEHIYPVVYQTVSVDLQGNSSMAYGTYDSVWFVSAKFRSSLITYNGSLTKVTSKRAPMSDAISSVYLEVYQPDPETGKIVLIGCSTNTVTTRKLSQSNPESSYQWNFSGVKLLKSTSFYFKLASYRSTAVMGTDNPKVYNTSDYLNVKIMWRDNRGSDTIYTRTVSGGASGSYTGAWPGALEYSYGKQ